jgi:predicted dithiol-disulfide oxidoreductase (DUF899 family)
MKASDMQALPKVVPAAEWQAAYEKLPDKENAATRARDALAAERKRPHIGAGCRRGKD